MGPVKDDSFDRQELEVKEVSVDVNDPPDLGHVDWLREKGGPTAFEWDLQWAHFVTS